MYKEFWIFKLYIKLKKISLLLINKSNYSLNVRILILLYWFNNIWITRSLSLCKSIQKVQTQDVLMFHGKSKFKGKQLKLYYPLSFY